MVLCVAAGAEVLVADDIVDAMAVLEIPETSRVEVNGVWCKETEAIPPGLVGPLVVASEVPEALLVHTKNGSPLGSRVIAVPTTVRGEVKQRGVPIQAVTPEIVQVAHVAVDVRETLGRGGPSDTINLLVVV